MCCWEKLILKKFFKHKWKEEKDLLQWFPAPIKTYSCNPQLSIKTTLYTVYKHSTHLEHFLTSYPPPLKNTWLFTTWFLSLVHNISQLLEIYTFIFYIFFIFSIKLMLNYVPKNKDSYSSENFRTHFSWIIFLKRSSV